MTFGKRPFGTYLFGAIEKTINGVLRTQRLEASDSSVTLDISEGSSVALSADTPTRGGDSLVSAQASIDGSSTARTGLGSARHGETLVTLDGGKAQGVSLDTGKAIEAATIIETSVTFEAQSVAETLSANLFGESKLEVVDGDSG